MESTSNQKLVANSNIAYRPTSGRCDYLITIIVIITVMSCKCIASDLSHVHLLTTTSCLLFGTQLQYTVVDMNRIIIVNTMQI